MGLPRRPKHAIIYFPGLSVGGDSFDVELVAQRLASACDRNANSGAARFHVVSEEIQRYDGNFDTRVCTVVRTDPAVDAAPGERADAEPTDGSAGAETGGPAGSSEESGGERSGPGPRSGPTETPLVDVYELRYGPVLWSRLQDRLPIHQALVLIRLAALSLLRVCTTLVSSRALSAWGKLRIGGAGLVVLAFALFSALSLFVAGASVLDGFFDDTPVAMTEGADTPPTSDASGSPRDAAAQGTGAPSATNGDSTALGAADSTTALTQSDSAAVRAAGSGAARTDSDSTASKPAPGDGARTKSDSTAPGSTARDAVARATSAGRGWRDAILRCLQIIIVVFTGFGLLTRTRLKDLLETTALRLASTYEYLAVGARAAAVRGQFGSLLEHLREKRGGEYEQITVLSYSFGAVIALDVLFPRDTPDSNLAKIDRLLTIGLPFDFIRALWPGYFTERRSSGALVDEQWVNLYNPADLLGSNFEDVGETPHADELPGLVFSGSDAASPARLRPRSHAYSGGIGHADAGFLDRFFLLGGARVHQVYWGGEGDSAASCLTECIRWLAPDEPDWLR